MAAGFRRARRTTSPREPRKAELSRAEPCCAPAAQHGEPGGDLHVGLRGVRRLLRLPPGRGALSGADSAGPAGLLAGQRGRGLRAVPPAAQHRHAAGSLPAAPR